MNDIFISYSKKDIVIAKKLYEDFVKLGYIVWIDINSLKPGKRWESEILDAIRNSRLFIALLSNNSVNKRGYVQKELKEALDELKMFPENETYIIPVRIEECLINNKVLKEIQWVDIFPNYLEGFNKLCGELRSIIKRDNLQNENRKIEKYEFDIEKQFIQIYTKAINNIIKNRSKNNCWGDVRCTTLALWALSDFYEKTQNISNQEKKNLIESRNWLINQAREEDRGISWESEAWDTSLCIISLSYDKTLRNIIDRATQWLDYIRDIKPNRGSYTGVWHDEVWETTLATIALLRSSNLIKGPINYEKWFWIEDIIKWLSDIPSKSSGEFVCPHYSGFIIWLLGEIMNNHVTKQILESSEFILFENKSKKALEYVNSVIDDDISDLWSSYTFSNSYILLGLSSLGQELNSNTIYKVVRWYSNKQSAIDGSFEDVEDTSLAILALSSLLNSAKIDIKGLSNNFQ
jgi:hypothetical protein